MSRIGQNPVVVPEGVTVDIEGRQVTARGKLGELSMTLVDEVEIAREDDALRVRPRGNSRVARNMWGTTRSLVQNLVTGVSEGFTVRLDITGVGYRAAVEGSDLVMQLGFSHEVRYPVPEDVTITCPTPTQVAVSGADRQRVGQVAANIRGFRPPEPYKGKGVRYADEYILRKEGKKK